LELKLQGLEMDNQQTFILMPHKIARNSKRKCHNS
jgi:hypothetical protein